MNKHWHNIKWVFFNEFDILSAVGRQNSVGFWKPCFFARFSTLRPLSCPLGSAFWDPIFSVRFSTLWPPKGYGHVLVMCLLLFSLIIIICFWLKNTGNSNGCMIPPADCYMYKCILIYASHVNLYILSALDCLNMWKDLLNMLKDFRHVKRL